MKAYVENSKSGRKLVYNACAQPGAIERGMRILGGKWTGSILWHLQDEPVRFNDLVRLVGGASKKTIAERLRQLENQGLVTRQVLDTSPIAVEYGLTTFGATALTFLDELRLWLEGLPQSLTESVVTND